MYCRSQTIKYSEKMIYQDKLRRNIHNGLLDSLTKTACVGCYRLEDALINLRCLKGPWIHCLTAGITLLRFKI